MKAPTATELVEAVRERMEQAAERPVGGFEARVIGNVLAIVERELRLGPDVEAQRRSLLAELDMADDESLAAAIRADAIEAPLDDLRARLLALAEAQLTIDNPRWLGS